MQFKSLKEYIKHSLMLKISKLFKIVSWLAANSYFSIKAEIGISSKL
jgi:hypothetical protein